MSKPKGSSFAIATDIGGTRRWWLVRIHPNVEHLRRAARRYSPDMDFSTTAGVCQAAVWRDRVTGEVCRYGANGYAGVIRLTPPYITGEMVAHELLHAAVATYRMNFAVDVRLGDEPDDREENLAYIYGDLHADFERQFNRPA